MSEESPGVTAGKGLPRERIRELYREHINPGMVSLMSLLEFDVPFTRAEGMRVWDREGNEYLDFLAGYGSLGLGHNPPEIWAALDETRGMPVLVQASLSPLAATLGADLARMLPGGLSRSFFCGSGAEAVEAALKLARGAAKKPGIVYCDNSFHGKSFGALSVTGRRKYQEPFAPLLPGCRAVPYADLEALEAELARGDVAAFIVEPIQGEGGIVVPPPGYLRGVASLCRRHGVLFIADEIQTGLGRTGRLLACQAEDVAPDILCLAKFLGGGVMPLGACVTTPAVWDRAYGGIDRCLLHTSTFGGNALSAAAGIATLRAIRERDLPSGAAERGEYFLVRLRELAERHPLLKEVRGRGLLVGLEFQKPAGILDKLTGGAVSKVAQEYAAAMVAGELLHRHRIITAYTLNNPNVIRLEPPLIVERDHLDRVVEALDEVLGRVRSFWGLARASARTALGGFFRGDK